jgi:TPR repeat protein
MWKTIFSLLLIFISTTQIVKAEDLCDTFQSGVQLAKNKLNDRNIEESIRAFGKVQLQADYCENSRAIELVENIRNEARLQKKPNIVLRLAYICANIKMCSHQSLQIFTEAAELGSVEAEYELGLAYKLGRFRLNWKIPPNTERAAYWWKRAVSHGDINAAAYLAELYDDGDGVIQDYQKALSLRRKAAKQGQADAMFGLATMYADGRGIRKNSSKAYLWYSLASQREIETLGFKNQVSIDERDKAARQLSNAALHNAQKEAQRCMAEKYKNCE